MEDPENKTIETDHLPTEPIRMEDTDKSQNEMEQVNKPMGVQHDSNEPIGIGDAEQVAEILWCRRPIWQLRLYLILALIFFAHPWSVFPFVFIFETPEHHCKLSDNATINSSIPWTQTKEGDWVIDSCHMYANSSHYNDTTQSEAATIPCNDGYVFKFDGSQRTVVSDFSLVCGKAILSEVYMSTSSALWAVGRIIGSTMTDIYGRKVTLLLCLIGRPVVGLARSLSPNFALFCAADFVGALTTAFLGQTVFIMAMELVPKRHRALTASSLNIFFALGFIMSTPVAWALRNWRHQEAALSAPLVGLLAIYWFIPESFTWLLAKGRYKEVNKIVKAGQTFNSRFNKDAKAEPGTGEGLLDDRTGLQLGTREANESGEPNAEVEISRVVSMRRKSVANMRRASVKTKASARSFSASIRLLTSSPKMRIYGLIMLFLWFSNSIIYWALNLTVTSQSGDKYLNYFLNALAELPAAILQFFLLPRYGRRIPTSFFHFLAGFGLFCTLIELIDTDVDLSLMVTIFNFVGKLGISTSYCCIFLYSPELFPTDIRGFGFGMCGFIAMVGSMISPYCRPLEKSYPGLVRGLCGALSVIAGCLVLVLPETLGRPLPSTVAEVESWTRKVPRRTGKKKQRVEEGE